jgi:hypothetical protein
MSCPRIEVDLDKIRRNTETVVRRLDARETGVTAVTKAVCGHPAIAQAMACELRAKPMPPVPYGFIAHIDTAFMQKVFYISQ